MREKAMALKVLFVDPDWAVVGGNTALRGFATEAEAQRFIVDIEAARKAMWPSLAPSSWRS
jgi:hypothetical protein